MLVYKIIVLQGEITFNIRMLVLQVTYAVTFLIAIRLAIQ